MNESKRRLVMARLRHIAGEETLTARAVVADASDPSSPLHSYFEWDDSVAAKNYRMEQARRLISHVSVEIRTDTRFVRSVAYVRDPRAAHNQQGYCEVSKLRSEHQLARDALAGEMDAIRSRLSRARSLADALSLGDDFEGLLERIVGFRERLEEAA